MDNEYRHGYRRLTDGELQRVVRETASLPPMALAALKAELYLRKHGLEEGQTVFTQPVVARPTGNVPSGGLFSGCIGQTIKLGLFVFALYVLAHVLVIVLAVLELSTSRW